MSRYHRSSAELLIETYQRDAAWAHRDMIDALEAGRVIDARRCQLLGRDTAAFGRDHLIALIEAKGRTTHAFDSTGDAYDETQCNEAIKTGHMLIIENERVIGLAATWPVAVTAEHGALHSCADGYTWRDYPEFAPEQVIAAITEARARGWKLDPTFCRGL